MKILAIETSCDETAISIVEAKGNFKNPRFEILSNVVASQVKLHAKWGGVVPNLAKREHQTNLIPVLKKALKKSNLLIPNSPPATPKRSDGGRGKFLISKQKTSASADKKLNKILEREPELLKLFLDFIPTIKTPKIDAIAVTVGPGLEPALWVGVNFAKALNLVWGKPVIPVNHMEGHLLSVLLNRKQFLISNFQFPILGLLVSGGHTELVLISDWLKYKIVGQTRDDAVGEAFDKVARMLNLPYPGGPEIAALAAQNQKREIRNSKQAQNSKFEIKLPRPMLNSGDFDFSFSGLKTAVLYEIKKLKTINNKLKTEFCSEFQQAAIDVLVSKTIKAAEKYGAKTVILGGGVAANKELRKQLGAAVKKEFPDSDFLLPDKKFTTDNAAMIAAAAYFRALKNPPAGGAKNPSRLKADGNMALK
ncbi:MAG: tRNA (adenosine(37)-N6)-threonylcarbamoyltransferase complex transferase subunit TsaD [bacterium]|nr:tRNA (adenosine(37)-N6)-threonylcarbamoyltransferase complex transferase subunit TsaD [bacterium]